MIDYGAAWRAVKEDVKSTVPVPHEMPDRAPRSVEEALLMFDILDKRVTLLVHRIKENAIKPHTSIRREILLLLTTRFLRFVEIQQGYLNKATDLLEVEGQSPDTEIARREVFLNQQRNLAGILLHNLKEMSVYIE